jgi:hypothetical protein
MRLFETNLDALKTNLGQALIPIATQALQIINGLLEAINGTGNVSLADGFKNMFEGIDEDTERKMAQISETATSAKDLVKILNDINNGTVTTTSGETKQGDIFTTMAQLAAAGGDVEGYLRGIGLSVEDTTRDYNVWLGVMQRLQTTIPGVSSVLNAQTGEIDGGTEALYSYIDAWQKAQEAAVIGSAFERKKTVISQMKTAIADTKVELYIALAELDRYNQQMASEVPAIMEREAKNFGMSLEEFIKTQYGGNESALRDLAETMTDTYSDEGYWAAVNRVNELEADLRTTDNLLKQTEEDIENGERLYEEMFGVAADGAEELIEDLTQVQKARLGDTQALDDITKALESFADASERIADIHQETWDDTAKSVDSVIKGFERFLTPAQKAREEMQQLTEASLKYDENGQLSKSWTDAESSLPQMGKMLQSMKDQITYMQEYQNMLAALEAQNVGADILAYFADGSMENYDILAELLENPTRLQDFVDLYQQREAAKGTFTSTLTDYKLKGNDEYQALVDTASEAISQLDMANPAQDSAERTVEGIAVGIAAALPEVTAQVNAVLEQVARLANLGGYTYGSDFFGGGGTLIFSGTSRPSYGISGSNAGGLDYVPFDGYLSMLHQGEAVLTAEEARVWRNMQYSRNSGIDYDALGGVMRDNVQAGGNVYLEGRTVGKVLSAVQADSYRGLERSGWQG